MTCKAYVTLQEFEEFKKEYNLKNNIILKNLINIVIQHFELMKIIKQLQKGSKNMHKKIMTKAAKELKQDAKKYAKKEKVAKKAHNPVKAKHEKVEKKEALSAAKDLKKRAKKAHEYN